MSFKYERFLIEAIEQCHLSKLITCIKHGHNIHIQNDLGQNLLVHLVKQQNSQDPFFEKKRFQTFQFLINHCLLETHTFDYLGKNLFNWTTNLNCTQEALYLLRSYPGDIDILIRDQSGLCSLHYAIEHGNTILVHAIVEYLLQYRMRFDIKDSYNNTPEGLARKLGYDDIADYLSETCRSTIFLSRELPFSQQRIMSNKSKRTTNTKSSSTTLSSSIGSSISDASEFHNLIESKIEAAKALNDWKAVAALRSYKRNPNSKRMNHLRKVYELNLIF
jgi:ankyrin repeat protein